VMPWLEEAINPYLGPLKDPVQCPLP
jgi:hypothetical protein